MDSHVNSALSWVLVAMGLYVVGVSPLAGVAIIACSLAFGTVRLAIEARDTKRAREVIDKLADVVNENAKRLEQNIVDVQKIQNDLAFSQNARAMGLK